MSSEPNPFGDVAVRRVRLSSQVYDAVKRAVVDGVLHPGQEVSEVSLARQLEVSRTPLREAVNRLEAHGFLSRDGERLFVPELSRRELEDLYAIRAQLEGLAARQAAERATPTGIAALRACHDRIQEYYGLPERFDELVAAGTEFHDKIAELSGNAKNLVLIRNILEHIARYRSVGALEAREMYLADHARIVEAIASGDGEIAEAAVREHLRHALEHVLERLPAGLQHHPSTAGSDGP